MQVLIKASGRTLNQQQAAFFTRDDDSCFSMHFATRRLTEDNQRLNQWHCMSFKRDFVDSLARYQCLPISSYQAQADEIKSKEDAVLEKNAVIINHQRHINDIQNYIV